MLRLRTHVLICLGFFVALLVVGWGGAILADLGVGPPSPSWRWPLLALLFVLVLGFAFSAVPVMVLLVTGAQARGPLATLATPPWQRGIVYGMWTLMALGSAIAIPAAFLLGGFDDLGIAVGHGSSQGTLVAKPGMSVEEVKRASTLAVNDGGLAEPPVLAEGIVFDFVIAGTAIRLPACRYYYMSTFTKDPKRIQAINVGVSHDKLSRAKLEQADAELRARLAADGWLTGHEEYRDEEDRMLHGGLERGPEGGIWLKDGTILNFEDKRMDDAVAGEDAATAGEWIQVVSLWMRDDYSGIERFVFAPPAPAAPPAASPP